MDDPRRRAGHGPLPDLSELAPLETVRAELAEVEVLARQVGDLTTLLRARLAPEEFRLVWALRDAAECLAIAELLLHDRLLVDRLARHLPARSVALRTFRRDLLGDEHPDDEVG